MPEHVIRVRTIQLQYVSVFTERSTKAMRVVGVVLIAHEIPALMVESIQPVRGSNPQVAGAILVNGLHRSVTQTIRIGRIVPIDGDPVGSQIQSCDPRALGADPQAALSVRLDGGDDLTGQMGERFGDIRSRSGILCCGVKCNHSADETDPQDATCVLVDDRDLAD